MQKSETFTALNGLRFLAALAVVIFHYAPRVEGYSGVPGVVRNVINKGPAAVGFFFILSGFVLAHRHLSGDARVQSATDFYWARFVRLYPGYLLAFLLFLPIAAQRYILNPSPADAGHRTFALSAALSCLMLQSWTPLAQAWNGPSWSLSVEAFMYLMFPMIGFRVVRLGRRNTTLVLLLSWLIPSSLATAYAMHWIPELTWRLYITNDPLLWMPLFVMGICVSRLVSDWKTIPVETANALSAGAFVALILVAMAWPQRWAEVFVTGGIAPLLAAVILLFTRTTGWITRTIGGALVSKFGEASYLVYILQAPLWHYWQETTNSWRGIPLPTSPVAPWQFVVFVPLLVLTSLAVQGHVESPVRVWLTDWKRRHLDRNGEEIVKQQVSRPVKLLES